MFYTVFISASPQHINWLRETIEKRLEIRGHVNTNKTKHGGISALKYAKAESIKLLKRLYHQKDTLYLTRKFVKIQTALRAGGVTW